MSAGADVPSHWPGTSALVVPVPAFEQVVRARWAAADRSYVSPDQRFGHAHVTLLAPFVDGLEPRESERVAGVLRRHRPFTARFTGVDVFPDGTAHVVVEDEAPFRELTAAL